MSALSSFLLGANRTLVRFGGKIVTNRQDDKIKFLTGWQMYILREKFEELSLFTEVCRNFAPITGHRLKGPNHINTIFNA
jgi:hypothetical protein